MSDPKTLHEIGLLATVHLATTLWLSNESQVVMKEQDCGRSISCNFAAGQQIVLMVKDFHLKTLAVALRQNVERSVSVYQAAVEAGYKLPELNARGLTNYAAITPDKYSLERAPMMITSLGLMGDRSKLLAETVTSLMSVIVDLDGVTDHFATVKTQREAALSASKHVILA